MIKIPQNCQCLRDELPLLEKMQRVSRANALLTDVKERIATMVTLAKRAAAWTKRMNKERR